jgi:DNA-binding CsgD family transcriptional regulator
MNFNFPQEMSESYDYKMFDDFIVKYIPQGFHNINRADPFMIEMDKVLSNNHQFFYIADLIHIKVLFTSKGIWDMLRIEPDLYDPGNWYLATHPDELMRHNLCRAKVFKTGHDLFVKQKGFSIISIPYRLNNGYGQYSDILSQGYSFYSDNPYKTVFILFVFTDISKIKVHKLGGHHYLGNDPTLFRYPDEEMLKIGHIFTDREIEILQLIAAGLESDQIAQRLYLSVNTINTHRRNMIKKTNKSSTHDLIIEMQQRGII